MRITNMENKATTYYTLKFERTDSLHKKGEVVVVPSGELGIGQQDDCKIMFENDTEYEDEQYAVIRPTRNEGEWQFIPTSEHVKSFVNGIPVNLVYYLNDGDRISFDNENQELLFKIHCDDKCDEAKGVQLVAAPISRTLLAVLIVMPVVLFSLLAGYIIKANTADAERYKLLDTLRKSVLQISVDSVLYVEMTSEGEKVIRKYSYQAEEGHVINGTAFLTTDSDIVTARHCIEPWLNDSAIEEANTLGEVESVPSSWAMEAETYNQTHNRDTTYSVVSICSFYRGQNGTEQFGRPYKSSEFVVNKTRDRVVEKGDFKDVLFWRSIKETYSYKDMMLGDIAWAAADSVGGVSVATEEEIAMLLSARPTLFFMGYPDHNTMRGFSTTEGRLQMDYVKGNMIAHDGNLIHGCSGAPVIVIKSNKAYAVGVVSRIDANGGGRTYSVPVTELDKRGGER